MPVGETLQAALLGLVQGLTEFLPISSSGHLLVVPWLLGWTSPLLNSLTFASPTTCYGLTSNRPSSDSTAFAPSP